MNKFILMFCLILCGCATKPVAVLPTQDEVIKTSPASKQELEKPKTTLKLDKELLKECENFSKLVGSNPTPNQVLAQHANDVKVHTTCRLRHSALIKIVTDAFNIRE